MINSAQITNFQSHKDSLLEFHKGVNVIVGETDAGKSGILRALKWLIDNRPGGDEFRSDWGGDTSMELKVDKNKVIRSKTKSDNIYQINDTVLKAFGTNVPEEVQSILKMDRVNMHEQMDNHFLISETSGNVALHFNKMAKLSKIDNALQYVQKEINTLNQDIKYNDKEIVEKKEQLDSFIDLEALESDLKVIEDLEAKEDLLNKDIETLDGLQFSINITQNAITGLNIILLPEKDIDKILKLYDKKQQAQEEYKKLKKFSLKIYYLQEDIKKAEKEIKAENDIDNILNIYQDLAKQKQELKKLSKLYESIEDNKIGSKNASFQLKRLEKEFKDNFPNICPLCETKIK